MSEKTNKEEVLINNEMRIMSDLISHARGGLKIDGSYFISGYEVLNISRRVDSINKRTRERIKKGLVGEDNSEITYDLIRPSEANLQEKVEDIIKNPKDFKGRVSLGQNDLLGAEGNPNQDVLYFLRSLNKALKSNNNRALDLKYSVIKFNDYNVDELNRYEVAGVIKTSTGSFAVHSLTNNSLPVKYYEMDHDSCKDCDHCAKKRARNDVFILRDKESDEYMQVGGSCIDVFIEKDKLKNMLKISDFIMENTSGKYYRDEEVLSKVDYIAHVIESMNKTGGYISKDKRDLAIYDLDLGTSERALYAISQRLLSEYVNNLSDSMSGNRSLSISEKREILDKNLEKISIHPDEEDYELANEIVSYYQENRIKLIRDVKPDNYRDLKLNAINSISSKNLFFDGMRQASYMAIAVNNYIKEQKRLEISMKREDELSKMADGRVRLDRLSPFLFEEEKTKVDVSLKILFVKEKISYSGGYQPHPITKYVLTGVTPDGSIVKASTTALDKFGDVFRDDKGRLFDASELSGKIKDRYVNISGSIKSNVSFMGDNGSVEYTELRINSISDATELERSNNDIVINGKVDIYSNLKVDNVIEGYFDVNDEPLSIYRYFLKNDVGEKFVIDSDTDINLEVGKFYHLGGLKRGVNNNVTIIQKPERELIKESNNEDLDFDKDKKYTKNQVKKLIGVNKKPASKRKIG